MDNLHKDELRLVLSNAGVTFQFSLPIIDDLELIYSDQATIIKEGTKRTVVKKANEDEENRLVATLYCLLKHVGYSTTDILKLLDKAKDVRKVKDVCTK